MKILALESSAKAASVCIMDGRELIAHYFQCSGLTHSRTLLKMAEDMLHGTGLKISDIDMVAVAKGPGSFTGIRIGVAAAKGLAWGADKAICGVSTLEAMAYQTAMKGYIICPVMDARRSQVYNALFQSDGNGIERLCPDRAISITDLVKAAGDFEKPFYLVGDGAKICAEEFEKAGVPFGTAPDWAVMQSAVGVALAAVEKGPEDDVIPNYLRLSQAERERLEKEKNTK